MLTKILKLNERQDKVENGLPANLNTKLEVRVTSIDERFETQQKALHDCLAAMETQLTANTDQLHTHAAGGTASATETVQDIEDMQSRTNSLILFSVPEGRAETAIARNAEDADIAQ